MAGGRPTKYDPKYCKKIEEYFNKKNIVDIVKTKAGNRTIETVYPCNMPLFQEFATKIGVHVDTLHEWKKKHKEFSESYTLCQQHQHRILVQNALNGHYNSKFSWLLAKNILGFRDKTEQVIEANVKSETIEDYLKTVHNKDNE